VITFEFFGRIAIAAIATVMASQVVFVVTEMIVHLNL